MQISISAAAYVWYKYTAKRNIDLYTDYEKKENYVITLGDGDIFGVRELSDGSAYVIDQEDQKTKFKADADELKTLYRRSVTYTGRVKPENAPIRNTDVAKDKNDPEAYAWHTYNGLKGTNVINRVGTKLGILRKGEVFGIFTADISKGGWFMPDVTAVNFESAKPSRLSSEMMSILVTRSSPLKNRPASALPAKEEIDKDEPVVVKEPKASTVVEPEEKKATITDIKPLQEAVASINRELKDLSSRDILTYDEYKDIKEEMKGIRDNVVPKLKEHMKTAGVSKEIGKLLINTISENWASCVRVLSAKRTLIVEKTTDPELENGMTIGGPKKLSNTDLVESIKLEIVEKAADAKLAQTEEEFASIEEALLTIANTGIEKLNAQVTNKKDLPMFVALIETAYDENIELTESIKKEYQSKLTQPTVVDEPSDDFSPVDDVSVDTPSVDEVKPVSGSALYNSAFGLDGSMLTMANPSQKNPKFDHEANNRLFASVLKSAQLVKRYVGIIKACTNLEQLQIADRDFVDQMLAIGTPKSAYDRTISRVSKQDIATGTSVNGSINHYLKAYMKIYNDQETLFKNQQSSNETPTGGRTSFYNGDTGLDRTVLTRITNPKLAGQIYDALSTIDRFIKTLDQTFSKAVAETNHSKYVTYMENINLDRSDFGRALDTPNQKGSVNDRIRKYETLLSEKSASFDDVKVELSADDVFKQIDSETLMLKTLLTNSVNVEALDTNAEFIRNRIDTLRKKFQSENPQHASNIDARFDSIQEDLKNVYNTQISGLNAESQRKAENDKVTQAAIDELQKIYDETVRDFDLAETVDSLNVAQLQFTNVLNFAQKVAEDMANNSDLRVELNALRTKASAEIIKLYNSAFVKLNKQAKVEPTVVVDDTSDDEEKAASQEELDELDDLFSDEPKAKNTTKPKIIDVGDEDDFDFDSLDSGFDDKGFDASLGIVPDYDEED